jgi:hypothetical protein
VSRRALRVARGPVAGVGCARHERHHGPHGPAALRGPVAGVGCARHCASVHRLKADTTCTYAA